MHRQTTRICDENGQVLRSNFFLFHPAGAGYVFGVPINRFWTAGSGAHLSEKVTLKHAHSSCFAHPTATFDPSIHISIERPTHWCQNIPNPPPIGTRTCPGKKRFARSGPPWLLQPFEVVHRGGIGRFFAGPYCWHGVDAHKGIRKGLAATIGLATSVTRWRAFRNAWQVSYFETLWQVPYEFAYPVGILEFFLEVYCWFVLCNLCFLKSNKVPQPSNLQMYRVLWNRIEFYKFTL